MRSVEVTVPLSRILDANLSVSEVVAESGVKLTPGSTVLVWEEPVPAAQSLIWDDFAPGVCRIRVPGVVFVEVSYEVDS